MLGLGLPGQTLPVLQAGSQAPWPDPARWPCLRVWRCGCRQPGGPEAKVRAAPRGAWAALAQ